MYLVTLIQYMRSAWNNLKNVVYSPAASVKTENCVNILTSWFFTIFWYPKKKKKKKNSWGLIFSYSIYCNKFMQKNIVHVNVEEFVTSTNFYMNTSFSFLLMFHVFFVLSKIAESILCKHPKLAPRSGNRK